MSSNVLQAKTDKHPGSSRYSAEEWRLRQELAACYRLIAHFRMTDLIFTHISARIPGPEHHFLINPYGLWFDEITASNLVKIDLQGQAVEPSPYSVNPAGFVIHSAIHGARENAQCVLHTHTRAGCAVAAQRDGLLPLNQISMEFYGNVAYHDYEGIALDLDERERLVKDLGDKPVLILRNHGLLTNLVINAIVHAYGDCDRVADRLAEKPIGTIRITAQADGPDRVRIDFIDDGAGIAPEHLSKVFDPFFTTKRGQGGSGLGLHIVFNTVTGPLGGTVSVQSWPGQGTRFTILLPREAPAMQPALAEEPALG